MRKGIDETATLLALDEGNQRRVVVEDVAAEGLALKWTLIEHET